MSRVIIYFKDSNVQFVNIPGTDIFEQGEYLHIYNGQNLVSVLLKDTIKIIYISTKKEG